MDQWLIIAGILLFAVLFWFSLNKINALSRPAHPPSEQPPKTQNYHGVSIHACADACANVVQIQRKRFLAREAPLLPVYGCNHPQCSCHYCHHSDRRSLEDRRYPTIEMDSAFAKKNQRAFKNRRRSVRLA